MFTPLRIDDNLVLDPRKAAWLPRDKTLVVADTHLGYEWVHRSSGNLLPLCGQDEAVARLISLAQEYQPCHFVLLGDIVHQAAPLPALVASLSELLAGLSDVCRPVLIAGNHDRALAGLLARCGWTGELHKEWNLNEHLFLHGDNDTDAENRLRLVQDAGKRILMGHEHPAVRIGDGVTTSAKCPCFLVARHLVILPAFSAWAGGTNIRNGDWLSAYARHTSFERIVAVLGKRLLPIPARQTRAR